MFLDRIQILKEKVPTVEKKVKPSNGNFTKSDIYFLLKYIKVFQWLSKSEFVSFMTKVNPNNGNKTKSDIFPRDIFKSNIIFIDRKILKYFKDFYNWHFSISLQKWAQSSKVKLHGTCANLTVFFIYKLFLNDFWNLFLDKLYH